MGRLVAAGVLETTLDVAPHRTPVAVQDALWAGTVEPRILEVLPALIVKRPSLFADLSELPHDLAEAVRALRGHRTPEDFRGVPGPALLRWLPSVGRRGKLPSRLKTFRLQADDLALLEQLSGELGLSQSDVVRRGLRHLAAARLAEPGAGRKRAKP
jgi:hypothetical protein